MSLLSPEVRPLIQGKTIILDTNVFIEGFRCPAEFSLLLNELAEADCALTTIEVVRLEFLSKNRSVQELGKKIEFYNNTLTYPALASRTFEQESQEHSLLFAFGAQAQAFKAVDFMLAATMKKYSASTLLLTNDHHDFTPQLFDLKTLFPLTPAQGSIITFGLYGFAEDKYATLISE